MPFHDQYQVCSANNFKASYHPENSPVYYAISEIKTSCTGLCQIWSQGWERLMAIYCRPPSICLLLTLGGLSVSFFSTSGTVNFIEVLNFHKWMPKLEDQTHFGLWSKLEFELRSEERQGHKDNILFHSIIQLLFVSA